MLRKLFTTAAIAATAGVLALSAPAGAEPFKIRIAYSVAPTHLAPLIPLMPKSVYKNWGKSYIVEPVRMRGSGPMLTALAAKEVEISGFSYQAFALSVVRANLDTRVIADVIANKAPYANTGFWVRKGEGIKTVKDLEGKRLAVNARGSGIDASLRNWMNKHGMKDGQDYQIVEVRFPAMLSALEQKRIDMGFFVLPFNLIAERKGGFKRLFTLRDSLGPNQTVVWASRKDVVENHRQALVDFMADHIRMRQWLYDPKNREQAIEIVAKATKRPAKSFASWVFTKKDNHRNMDAHIDVPLLQQNVDDLVKLKLTPKTFKIDKYVDMSIIADAKKQLN